MYIYHIRAAYHMKYQYLQYRDIWSMLCSKYSFAHYKIFHTTKFFEAAYSDNQEADTAL